MKQLSMLFNSRVLVSLSVVLVLIIGISIYLGPVSAFQDDQADPQNAGVQDANAQDNTDDGNTDDDNTDDDNTADVDSDAEDSDADEAPKEPNAIEKVVNQVDTQFGNLVVSPLESVIFFDLMKLYTGAVGPPKPRPAEEFWPEETKEALKAEVKEKLDAYHERTGTAPDSSDTFLKNVLDPNGGDGNPAPDNQFPKPSGYSYVFDADSQTLMMQGRPQIPFIVVWLLAGAIFFTLRMRFINFRAFWHAIRLTKGDYDDPKDPGEVSHFQALSSALSATVGLGNIAGVAIAIGTGGPGATFWMILIGLFGMTMKFNECTLGQLYRKIGEDGVVSGGPMRYLKDGLTEMKLKPLGIILALMFSILCIGASFGGGNAFQVRQSLDAIKQDVTFLDSASTSWIYGLVMAVMVGLVIVGGIKSIGKVASRIVPVMCAAYVGAALFILITNASAIPAAFGTIFSEAFSTKAMYGGFLGCMMLGIKRAVFSNEAGAGSAAIAHSAAKTDEPVSEGIVALLEPFIDTVVVCTMTALVVVVTGVYADPANASMVQGNEGAALTSIAFQEGGAIWFKWILYAAVVLFAYSTMISWSYYGERCWSGIFGARSAIIYKGLFLVFVVLGSVINPANVLNFSDMLILGMAFPNLMGGVILSGKVKRALDDYWARYKSGEIKPYK